MRIGAGSGSYYGSSGQNLGQSQLQQQQQQIVSQQSSAASSQNTSSIAIKQQPSSQQIMSSNKPITKTPLSSLIYQSVHNNGSNYSQQQQQQQQQQQVPSSYSIQQQQQQNSAGVGQYSQQLYSHSQHVSANHSRDNSINKQRQPERKMSITAQPTHQIQPQYQQQQGSSGNFYHHNHSHSHQIGTTTAANKPTTSYGSSTASSVNNGNGNTSSSQINPNQISINSTAAAGASSSTSSTSIQQSSTNSFAYKPAHKGSVVDSTIIQKLMKKQQQQLQHQQQQSQQYPFSQPQSFINSPKRSPKNSVSPNTRHPSFSQQTSQQQQLPGSQVQQSNVNVSGTISQQNSKNTYQQMYHQLSNNYSQSTSQKHSQQSSISQIPQQQQYHHISPQQPTSVLNVSANNISSSNIQASQNLNQGNDTSSYQNGASNQNTDKKPISFLNYLLLKEIAQRNTQDQINNNTNSNNLSNIDIMASKMNTPNNATKVLINNFNDPSSSQSINKSGNLLYGGSSGSSYNVFNQASQQTNHLSQQKQPQQDLDHSYLSKYSQLLQSQQQSKQVSQPPSPYTYNHSHKSSIASTANTNNMQGTTSMNSYSVSPQLPQSYSQQIPSTPTSTHRSQTSFTQQQLQQQQQQKQQQEYQQSSKSSKNNSNNVSGLLSNTLVASTNNIPQSDDLRIIPSCTSKNCFNFHYVIGKGGFGKVWKVEHRKTRQLFAMKEMSKSLIITKKSVNSVMNERNLLSQLKHPFLVNMFYAFQDRENLHLVMDLMPGGDLRYHIGRQRRFSEEQTRFFVACIFMGLEYLHNNNIIHRDIKPENLVLDSSGYVRITDLGIARTWKPDNANDTSGTPGYMAPEVMCRQPHTFAVDYFALGVLAYEFMLGRRPYLGRSRKEIRDQILAKRVQIKKHEIPDGWSLEAADFINRLIERKPANRLGINGPAEVKNHPWIKNYPWQKLIKKQIDAPFLPANEDNFDQKQQISLEDEQNNEIILQNAMLLKRPSVQSLFNGYNYDGGALQQQQQQQQQLQQQQAQQIQSPQPTSNQLYQPQSFSQSQQQYSQSISGGGSIYSLQQQVPQHQSSNSTVGYQNTGYQNPFSQRNNFSNSTNINQNMSHISQYSNANLKESNYNDNSMLSVTKNNINATNNNNNNNNSAINSSRIYQQNNNSRTGEKENFLPSRYSYDEVY